MSPHGGAGGGASAPGAECRGAGDGALRGESVVGAADAIVRWTIASAERRVGSCRSTSASGGWRSTASCGWCRSSWRRRPAPGGCGAPRSLPDHTTRATGTACSAFPRSGAPGRRCDVPGRDDGRDRLGLTHVSSEAEMQLRSLPTSTVRILWRRADHEQKHGPARRTASPSTKPARSQKPGIGLFVRHGDVGDPVGGRPTPPTTSRRRRLHGPHSPRRARRPAQGPGALLHPCHRVHRRPRGRDRLQKPARRDHR